MATPSKTASLVLNITGSQSIALKRGEKINVITKAGQRYRVVKEGEEAEAKDSPAQAAKDVAASQQGQDLLLTYADGTQLALVNFYEACKTEQCAVDMPGAKGTGSSGGYVITGDSPVGASLSGGGKLVYAYGETTSLTSLTQGAGQVQGFSQQDSLITYIPTSHASALWNLLPLGLGAVGAAVLLGNSDVKKVDSPAVGSTLDSATAGSTVPEARQPVALAKGLVMAGPVVSTNDLRVFLYQADEVTLIGEVTLDSTGRFEINLNGYVGVVVAKVTSVGSNFDYMDEATGQVKNLDFELGAVGVASVDGIVIYVNPLTAVAKLLLGSTPLTANLVEQANSTVAEAFGIDGSLIAPTVLTPVIDVDGNGQVGADPYGKILAAMSGLDERNSGDMSAAIRAFSADIQANGGALSAESKAYLVLGASDPQVQTMVPGIVAEIVASTQFTDAEMQSAINTLPSSLTALLQPTLQLVASIPLTRTVTTPSAALAADTGTSTSDGITRNGQMNVSGLESGATWEYSTDNATTWSAGTGTSFTLSAGSYTSGFVKVRQTDAAGNVSAAGSSTAAITMDSTAAAAPSLALAVDTGTSTSDGITSNGQMNVTGLESGATWEYSTDNATTWSAGTGTSFTLSAGSYTLGHVQVRQTDTAGNVSAVGTTSAAITVDSTAAAPSLALAADTGTSTSDGITRNGQMNVSGLESGATWEYSTDNATTWSAGTGTSFTLSAGSYTLGHIKVRQTDTAGNVSAAGSTSAAITADSTAPTASVTTASIDASGTATVQSTETGTAYLVNTSVTVSSLASITSAVDSLWNQATISTASTNTNLAATGLADGTYKLYTVDTAGNLSSISTNAVTVSSTPAAPTVAASSIGTVSLSGYLVTGTGGISYATDGSPGVSSVSSAGDVNGDGYGDFIVGVPYKSGGNKPGESYVVFGNSTQAAINLSSTTIPGFKISGWLSTFDYSSGFSVSGAGDVNGDGLDDLIVGAPYSEGSSWSQNGQQTEVGRAYVVFGKTSTTAIGLNSIQTVTPTGTPSTNGFLIEGFYAGQRTGYSVSGAGDVNGDGLADLLVGGLDTSGYRSVYVVFGKTSSTPIYASWDTDGDWIYDFSSGFLISDGSQGDRFKVSAIGDVNGDGLADISYSGGDQNGRKNYIIYGKLDNGSIDIVASAGISSSQGLNVNWESNIPDPNNQYSNLVEFNSFSVSNAGDVNGDGFSDVVFGDLFANKAYVVFGGSNMGGDVNLSSLAADGKGYVISGAAGTAFGASVSSAGDINGDGLMDLIIGSPSYLNAGGTRDIGRTYVVFGKTTTTEITAAQLKASEGFVITGSTAGSGSNGEQNGSVVSAAGDLNGDGLDDLLVGAGDYSSGTYQYSLGGVYVVWGGTTGVFANTAVDYMGTTGNDTYAATAAGQTLVGNSGDDTLSSNGATVMLGGMGNDTFVIDANMITALQNPTVSNSVFARLDGGGGKSDTISFASSGLMFDLTQVANQAASTAAGGSRIDGVEIIDITGGNTLKINHFDVLDMGTANLFATTSRQQLLIKGAVGDTVDLASSANTADWTQAGTLTYNTTIYDVWNHDLSRATIYIQQGVLVA